MEKIKNICLWGLGAFLILCCVVYINVTLVPSVLIAIAGVLILPPINKIIDSKFSDEKKKKSYRFIKNILVIVFVLIFFVNIGSDATTEKLNDVESINQKKIEKSIRLTVDETNGTYTGDRVDGKKDGKGKYEWNNGCIYEGEFKDDEINGKGKLTYTNKEIYEGNFDNGKKDGKGKYTFSNGDVYDGEWKEDKLEGNGTYTFSNGEKYVGEFVNNKFNGTGTYTKGKNKYKGTWINNEYQKKK